MGEFNPAKVVASLPGTLIANTLYLVRVGTGFRPYVTNASGTIVAYPLDPTTWSELASIPANLSALAGLTSAANKGIQFTGSGTAATFDLTAAGKALLDDADAAAQRATLGLGSIATQAASAVSITGGSVAGITDLAIADGGTGGSTAGDARINLQTPYLRVPQVYTSGATWTKPSNLAYVIVEAWGGGGGSTGSTGTGGSGGTSSFGSHCTAPGGSGSNSTYGGAGGTGTGGDINMTGGCGANSNASGYGGSGGAAPRGGGGGGYTSNTTGQAGGFPGGGAGATALGRGFGGGCGYTRKKIAAASLGSTESVTVGAAGAAGAGTGGLAGGAGLVLVEEWGY